MKTKYIPNIAGIHYHIGPLALTSVVKGAEQFYRFKSPFRVGSECGFTLFRIPHTTWFVWWITK